MKQWKTISKVKTPFGPNSGRGQKLKVKTDEIIKILLENRGIRTKKEVEDFFNPKIENVNIKTARISKKEVLKALRSINEAIKKNQQIVIFGDYDTDGICGTAILWETLYENYKNVFPYIPNRREEGYGLSEEGIKNVLDLYPQCGLIVTVDNGIVANKPVDFANQKKIETIIADHHQPGKKLPKAKAIIHSTLICGASVAYLLAEEIRNKKSEVRSQSHLELAALATVADMVPLLGLNRTIVKFGLEALKKTKRPGLLELFKEAGLDRKEIDVYEIGHMIAPRLNATGRVSHAMDSLRLICTSNQQKAKEYALVLSNTNKERQQMTIDTTDHAKNVFVEEKSVAKIVFVSSEEYDQGVIGLVASRLVEEYYKPSFVVSIGEKHSKGSARSIKGVNIIEMIRSLSDYIVEAGGHPMAAGFTIETLRIEEFRKALEKKADEIINEELLKKTVMIDLEIDLENINHDLYEQIEKLAPFGIANPEPTFLTRSVQVEDLRTVGIDGKHLKLKIKSPFGPSSGRGQKSKVEIDGIGFGMGERAKEIHIGDKIDVVYTIEENEWNDNKRMQLKIKDFKKNN